MQIGREGHGIAEMPLAVDLGVAPDLGPGRGQQAQSPQAHRQERRHVLLGQLFVGDDSRHDVQAGVQQCGVQLVLLGLPAVLFGQLDLAQHLAAMAEHSLQATETRPIVQVLAAEPLVEAVDRHFLNTDPTQRLQIQGRRVVASGRDAAPGMACPLRRRVFGSGLRPAEQLAAMARSLGHEHHLDDVGPLVGKSDHPLERHVLDHTPGRRGATAAPPPQPFPGSPCPGTRPSRKCGDPGDSSGPCCSSGLQRRPCLEPPPSRAGVPTADGQPWPFPRRRRNPRNSPGSSQ